MTFNELCGMDKRGNDAATGSPVSHKEKYQRAIQALGGLDEVVPYIPFSRKEISEALEKGDEYLNTLPLARWDIASGFRTHNTSVTATGRGLWGLYGQHGVNCVSNAEGVCLLKEAARMWVEIKLGFEM